MCPSVDIGHHEHERGGVFRLTGSDGDQIGELTYQRPRPEILIADHTWVHPAHRHHGHARALVDALAAHARSTGARIVPACSYVAVIFTRDRDAFRDVAAD